MSLYNVIKENDKALFALLGRLEGSTDIGTFATDENNYVYMATDAMHNYILWVADSFDDDLVIQNLERALESGNPGITTDIRGLNLLDRKGEREYYIKSVITSYSLDSEDAAKVESKGTIKRAETEADFYALADLHCAFVSEATRRKTTFEDAVAKLQNSKATWWFLQLENGDRPAMASVQTVGDHCYIAGVVTAPEYRHRGYAKALIADVCKRYDKPFVLYADSNYAAANKLYQSLGFKDNGYLYELAVAR